jgi:HD-like signal output (HDOD) protein
MQLATSAETAQVEDLIERIGISETLNLLAAVCVTQVFNTTSKLEQKRYQELGERISDLADDCEGF